MQRLQFVLFQMDEAKRYLTGSPLPGLRLALILLDNAAEILLDRWIEQTLRIDEMSERLQRQARAAGVPETHPQFTELFQQRFLSAKEKRKVSYLFDEKLHYVAQIKQSLSPELSSIISHLHRYRNEAYHGARVRVQTVRTYGVIFLELCCQLIEALRRVSAGYSSGEDFSWLWERFGLTPQDLWEDDAIARVLDEFRADLLASESRLRETLATNLTSRLDDLRDGLGFISKNANDCADLQSALLRSQEFTLQEIQRCPPYRRVPPNLNGPVSTHEIQTMAKAPALILDSSESFKAFQVYADTDVELERLEFMIQRFAGAIDEAIQWEVDRARGK